MNASLSAGIAIAKSMMQMKGFIREFKMQEMSQQLFARLTWQKGRIGYVIAWLLGVPASVLFVIFLIRGK